jgi:hypothetical protein
MLCVHTIFVVGRELPLLTKSNYTQDERTSSVPSPILTGHSTSTINLNGSPTLQPTSAFRIFHTMIENNEFDIDVTPKTYKQAMNSKKSLIKN